MGHVWSNRHFVFAASLAVGAVATAVSVTGPGPLPMMLSLLAHVAVSAALATGLVLSSRGTVRGRTEDGGWPSLRSLAIVTPTLLVAQVLLGSGYRHKVFGLLPHVAGALTAGMIALAFGMFAVIQCAGHAGTRRTGKALITLLIIQIVLGIAAALVRISDTGATPFQPLMNLSPAAHTIVGSLTLATCVLLSIQVLRNVQVPRVDLTRPGATAAQ